MSSNPNRTRTEKCKRKNENMKLPITAVCKAARIKRDGTAPISIQYCFTSEKRAILDTGIFVPLKYWNKKRECISDNLPITYGDPAVLNEQLSKEIRKAEDIVSLAIKKKENPLDFFKTHYSPGVSFESVEQLVNKVQKEAQLSDVYLNKDIFFQIDHYIKTKTKKVSKDMPRIYRNMKDHLLAFEKFRNKPVIFEGLDITFYDDLVDFLTYDYVLARRKKHLVGLKPNTVGKTIKQFKTFLKDRMKRKIIPEFDIADWVVLEVEVDAVYLSVAEIKAIIKTDVTYYPHLQDYKDDMILGCLTGLRFSDFSKIQQEDLRQGMLFKKQQKSDHRVVIPLRKEAKQILEMRSFQNFKPTSNAEFNRHIKNLARLAGITEPVTHSYKKGNRLVSETKPKYEWITSHTCRRSFCTNEFLAGTPCSLIMKISGHKSERDFFRYIRISPEEAAYKIQELWKERGEL